MQKSYLFYDLETSGINKCFDQILQFAAIRTDENLHELERYEFLVRLNPDTIPHPKASITHHISIEKANTGISEYEAVCRIFKLINTPNTISIGYNTLGFDDEFLRFSFFKNLLPPYDHQYKNNCMRMDLYPIVSAYYLFADDVLKWPVNEEQKTSLKLEHLNEMNHLFLQGRAHDAMSDVVVTLELAKKLKSANEKMWHYLTQRFDKAENQKVMGQLDVGLEVDKKSYLQALMVSGKFGSDVNFIAPVLSLGQHRHYKNQWCFLRLDLEDLAKANSDNFTDFIWAINKKWGEPPILLPAKKRFLAKFSQDRIETIKKNKAFLEDNPEVFIEIRDYILDYTYPVVENVDVDAALYQAGFMNQAEQNLSRAFHQGNVNKKVSLLGEMNKDYYQRALRVIGRLSPESLAADMQIEFQGYLEQIASYEVENMPVDYKGERKLSLPEAYEEIQKLLLADNLTEEQISLLEELESYLS